MVTLGRSIDRTGLRFGKWTVLRLHSKERMRRGTSVIWWCRCDCGMEAPVRFNNLRQGLSTQCRPCAWTSRVTHDIGERIGTRTLVAFDEGEAVWRCDCGYETKQAGSQVAGTRCRKCTDRIDTHGRMVTVNGETHSLAGWARKLGIERWAICLRIKKGMTPEAACTTPRMQGGRRAA